MIATNDAAFMFVKAFGEVSQLEKFMPRGLYSLCCGEHQLDPTVQASFKITLCAFSRRFCILLYIIIDGK